MHNLESATNKSIVHTQTNQLFHVRPLRIYIFPKFCSQTSANFLTFTAIFMAGPSVSTCYLRTMLDRCHADNTCHSLFRGRKTRNKGWSRSNLPQVCPQQVWMRLQQTPLISSKSYKDSRWQRCANKQHIRSQHIVLLASNCSSSIEYNVYRVWNKHFFLSRLF